MRHYAIDEISTKKKIIFDTGPINMLIELTKFTILLIFLIVRHNDVITILYWTYELRFKIRVSNFVCVLNFNS